MNEEEPITCENCGIEADPDDLPELFPSNTGNWWYCTESCYLEKTEFEP